MSDKSTIAKDKVNQTSELDFDKTELISNLDHNKHSGRVIQKYRNIRDYTILKTAKDTHIARNRLSKIEKGDVSATHYEIYILSNYLKIPVNELYNVDYEDPFTEAELSAFIELHKLNLSKSFLLSLTNFVKKAIKEGKTNEENN